MAEFLSTYRNRYQRHSLQLKVFYYQFSQLTRLNQPIQGCLAKCSNSLPVNELEKGALGTVMSLNDEPRVENAGIHDNPNSSNHQAPSHCELVGILTTSKREGGEGAKPHYRHEWHSRQTTE